MAIADKLTALRSIQKAIRSAITSKGITIEGDFSSYAAAINKLKNPTGTKEINANGNYTVADFENVSVNVPSSGIQPVGTKEIAQNGIYNVSEFEFADVSVPVGVFPSGTQNITENGNYNVENLAAVNVAVPSGAEVVTGQIVGSGSKILTIPEVIGKENVAVFMISTTSSNISISTIIGCGYIDNSAYCTYKSSSNIMRLSTTFSYDKTSGKLSYTGNSSYNFTNNIYIKYVYVAW